MEASDAVGSDVGRAPPRRSPAWLSPQHALLALAAALAVQQLPALPPSASGLTLAGIALACAARAHGALGRALVVLALSSGWTLWHAERALALRIAPALEGRDLEIEGSVDGLPERGTERISFELIGVRRIDGQSPSSIPGRLRLHVYAPQAQGLAAALVAGARVQAAVRLRRPRGVANPGGFDAERHALERRIAAVGTVRELHVVDRASRGFVDRARQHAADWIAAEQGNGRTAAVLRALAVGDQAPLVEADWAVFRATGTSHLIAISGFHVGLVGGCIALLAGLLWRVAPALALRWPRRQAQAAAGLLGASGYALLAGMSPPVARTLVMIAVVALAALLRRPLGPAQGLGLAALVALLADPLVVLNAGFWLSFAGVAWLIWCLDGRPREALALKFGRAQLAATLGLAPVGLALFQQVSLVGPVANLVAIPCVSLVIVPLLLSALALHGLAPGTGLGCALLAFAAATCEWLLDLLEAAARLPWSEWWAAPPPPWTLLVALVGTALMLAPVARVARVLGLVLVLPLYGPMPRLPAPEAVELWVLDVGQGQAILIRDRSHATLVDTGPAWGDYSAARAVVLPALRALGVRRLDVIVLSHGDNDHAGGAHVLQQAFPSAAVLAGPDVAAAAHCVAGADWNGAVYRVSVLHPPEHFPALGNDSACVLRVDAPGGRALLPADVGALIERRLVREQPLALAADVVVLPHHGSRSSSDPELVAAVGARIAIASVGWRNRHGHPAPEVVARWRKSGATVLSTAGSGAIGVRLVPDGRHTLLRWRDIERRYWREPEAAP